MFQTLDEEAFERLEETLIYADVGAPTTARIVERLETRGGPGELADGEDLTRRLRELLAEAARVDDDSIDLRHQPTVILVVGVNGTGKTTTIGKIAWHLQKELGQSVLLAAGDTFRAAAAEQLETWAERAGAELVRGAAGSDPGAVVYDAIEAAKARGHDVVIVDTAGPPAHPAAPDGGAAQGAQGDRRRRCPDAPHETLLTIDATTGQNGLRQAMLFREAVQVDGIVLTKLDGTAKGGIALAIAQELGVPVKLIGIGEALEDLRPFDADDFARAILEVDEGRHASASAAGLPRRGAGHAVPARPRVRGAVPPARRPARRRVRVRPLRQPDLARATSGRSASSRAERRCCSRRAWRRSSAVLLPSLCRGDGVRAAGRLLHLDAPDRPGLPGAARGRGVMLPHCRAGAGAAARRGHAALAREPVEPRPRRRATSASWPPRAPRSARRAWRSTTRLPRRSASARSSWAPTSRCTSDSKHLSRPRRPDARPRRGRRPGAGRGAARLAHAHGRDSRAVRGLARAPLAGHARRAARARVRERAGDRRAARGAATT